MKPTNKIFTVVLIMLFPIIGISKPIQNQKSKSDARIETLEKRVQQLENYKGNIDNLSKIQSENLRKYVDDEIKKGMGKIDDAKTMITWILWFGLPVTLISIAVGYFSAIKKAKKFVLDKIETVVEGNRDEIIRLIETEAFDTRLRNTKHLLVVSGDEESEESLKKFMTKLNFKNVKYRRAESVDNIPDHDLMIFNTPKGNLSQETIDLFMQNTEDEDICYVAYTTMQLNRDPRLNFSNSRFTLYHSILSTLKFSESARLN
ncbi:NARF domain-containing protein [Mucilaginibacter arboris]|uniref:Nucleotidyltransferase-Associated Rossmannoid Fold domain-containing protein n=1 Tax=Mucilaginibacter arboris TaxID=2682090 RepID=A0A7K1T090_9SPHI|nr:NARF domain-containing protein [Mucilaginibacter arboris]MVN22991.1 hypothetical protein [Mucilaginibacter arboris]